MKPFDRLVAGIEAQPDQRAQRRLESIAATFKPNAMYERLLADPSLLAGFPSTMRIAVGHYEQTKAAYEAVQSMKQQEHRS